MFTIKVDMSRLERVFTKVALGLSTPDPLLMGSLGDTLMTQVSQQINAGGRPAWAALKPATVARKKKLGKDNGILRLTGELLHPANRSVETSGSAVTLSFSKGYGVYHQDGVKPYKVLNGFGRGLEYTHPGMVARPLAVVDGQMENALADAAADYIDWLVGQ